MHSFKRRAISLRPRFRLANKSHFRNTRRARPQARVLLSHVSSESEVWTGEGQAPPPARNGSRCPLGIAAGACGCPGGCQTDKGSPSFDWIRLRWQ